MPLSAVVCHNFENKPRGMRVESIKNWSEVSKYVASLGGNGKPGVMEERFIRGPSVHFLLPQLH